jgi:hypothetical protein
MATRAYIREFVDRHERWSDLTDAEYRTLDLLHCLAVEQPGGSYRNAEILTAFLPKRLRRHVRTLLDRGLLVLDSDGYVHLLAWDEEQEGFDTVRDRQARRRAIKRGEWVPTVTPVTVAGVTGVTKPTVTPIASSTEHEALGIEQRASRQAREGSNGQTSSFAASTHDGRHGERCLVCFPLDADIEKAHQPYDDVPEQGHQQVTRPRGDT